MAVTLPADARQHIDNSCDLATIRNLTDAVERGELDFAALKGFVAAKQLGQNVTFAKTRPVSMRIKEVIEANPTEPPLKLIYKGVEQGLWSLEDAERWQENAAILSSARKTSIPRGVYLTRKRRTRQRVARVSDQFTPKIAMDIVCSHQLTDGAKTCLAILMGLAGAGTEVVTYTTAVATLMGRTARTVRNHFIHLEEAGLITRTPGKEPNTVRIVIHPMTKPEPYVEPRDITAFKLARRSKNETLRSLAETLAAMSWDNHCAELRSRGGRKMISAFNTESNPLDVEPVDKFAGPNNQRRVATGPTTYSMFTPTMRTDRNLWNRPRPGAEIAAFSGERRHASQTP